MLRGVSGVSVARRAFVAMECFDLGANVCRGELVDPAEPCVQKKLWAFGPRSWVPRGRSRR